MQPLKADEARELPIPAPYVQNGTDAVMDEEVFQEGAVGKVIVWIGAGAGAMTTPVRARVVILACKELS